MWFSDLRITSVLFTDDVILWCRQTTIHSCHLSDLQLVVKQQGCNEDCTDLLWRQS